MKRQKCTVPSCGDDSVPGLIRGHGKCQYHWNVGAFGQQWADKCRRRDAEEIARTSAPDSKGNAGHA